MNTVIFGIALLGVTSAPKAPLDCSETTVCTKRNSYVEIPLYDRCYSVTNYPSTEKPGKPEVQYWMFLNKCRMDCYNCERNYNLNMNNADFNMCDPEDVLKHEIRTGYYSGFKYGLGKITGKKK